MYQVLAELVVSGECTSPMVAAGGTAKRREEKSVVRRRIEITEFGLFSS
jgi:hypothetical protein